MGQSLEKESGYQPPEGTYSENGAREYVGMLERTFSRADDGPSAAIQNLLTNALKGKHDAIVVDIGAGNRTDLLEKWKNTEEVAKVIGVEPSEHMRSLAAPSESAGIEWRAGDWLATGLPAESVDVIVSRYSFHHVKKLEDAYREMARILKTGGRAIVTVPHPDFVRSILEKRKIEGKLDGEITTGTLVPMDVEGVPINYYYHTREEYFETLGFIKHFKLVSEFKGDWRTADGKATENGPADMLVFEVEKV